MSQQPMMPRGGGSEYPTPPLPQEMSAGVPLTLPRSRQHFAAGHSVYPTLGHDDVIKQLQLKISTLEHQLMCSQADKEKLHVELDKRTKELEGVNEKYSNLQEDFNFAQKCFKLEVKIAKSKATIANEEKIKELEEAVRKLKGDQKSLQESFGKQATALDFQSSLVTRLQGKFKKLAEAASENCKEIEGLLAGLSEQGVINLGLPASTPVEKIPGDSIDYVRVASSMEFPPSSWGSSKNSDSGRTYEELNFDEMEDMSPSPPAAFLDAIKNLTLEDLEELDRMAMELDKEVNDNT